MTTTQQILDVFEGYRMAPLPQDEYDAVGKGVLAQKLSPFVDSGKPVEFIMLGFPFKSTNTRDKVIGDKPDLGEELSLLNFAQFNADIKKVYDPGVQITIARDGELFNDLLKVSDDVVQEYGEISIDMGKQVGAPMEWLTLKDFYSGHNLSEKRDKVEKQFGMSEERFQQAILFNPDVKFLYMGMIRFMEEELADKPFPNRNQRHKAAKKLARDMMFRNESWSNLIRHEFPNRIRLSMHPSVNNGYKYSFQMIPGKYNKHSAWHAAIWVKPDVVETIHKKEAEELGLHLVDRYNRPYYYTSN